MLYLVLPEPAMITMANFKIVISDPKTKKAYQKEVDQSASGLIGRKIGDVVDGSFLGLPGYKLEITGGSDNQGFPMRKDVEGTARKKIILSQPPGFHPERKGQRKRKSVRGNTISAEISQVNTKVVEYGKKPLSELLGGVKKKPKEELEKIKKGLQEKEKTEATEPKQEKKSENAKESKEPKAKNVAKENTKGK